MKTNIAFKQRANRVNARKDAIEQNRIRLQFERKLRLQLLSAFAQIGQEASESYERLGRIPTTPFISNKISAVLLPHYRAVIESFAKRFQTYQKQETEFDRLINSFLRGQGGQNIQQVSDTTRKQIMRAIQVAQADDLGVAPTAKAILDSQRGLMTKRRASTIARTETHNASSFANHEMAKDLNIPQLQKQWVAVNDARTRGAHSAVSGTIIPMDEDFDVVVRGITYKMGYPSDPRGGAANVVNCRCTLIYVTPEDEVIVDEETVVVDKPLPPPIPERNRNAPIQPTDLSTIKILKKSVVLKQLNEQLSEAAQDPRYLNKLDTHYRGHKASEFGTMKMGNEITDESASVILVLKGEIDQIMDQVGLPRIRSIQIKPSKKFNMSMGDGILSINPVYVNGLVEKRLGKGFSISEVERQRRVQKLAEDIQPSLDEHRALTARQQVILREQDSLVDQQYQGLITVSQRIEQRLLLIAEYNQLAKKKKSLLRKIEKNQKERDLLLTTEQQFLKVSEWNPSKPLKERPFSSKSYLSDPLDRVRHTMYHEIGHQIHQTYKFEAKRRFLNSERGKLGLEPDWTDVNRPLDRWLDSNIGEAILYGGGKNGKIIDSEKAKLTWSEYGNYNGHEWFAENNANYWKGDREKVDPKFIIMMENILDGKDVDDTIISKSK